MASGLTVSKAQIRAVGDATITWIGDHAHLGLLGQYIEKLVRIGWDTGGVNAVAQLLTDAGVTVTE